MSSFHAPVREGDERELTVQTTGDEGDGIAKVERGYVIIIPDTDPGDEVKVTVTDVFDSFAFGRVVQRLD